MSYPIASSQSAQRKHRPSIGYTPQPSHPRPKCTYVGARPDSSSAAATLRLAARALTVRAGSSLAPMLVPTTGRSATAQRCEAASKAVTTPLRPLRRRPAADVNECNSTDFPTSASPSVAISPPAAWAACAAMERAPLAPGTPAPPSAASASPPASFWSPQPRPRAAS